MEEKWKDVKGFEGLYKISSSGKVYSYRSKSHLATWKDKDGYLRCGLSNNGKKFQFSVHRLIAMTFLENSENKPQINDKNGIRNDNRVENLEWVTALENQRHKFNVLGYFPSKECIQKMIEGAKRYANNPEEKKKRAKKMRETFSKKIIDITTGIIYNSQHEASEKLNCSQGLISLVCSGIRSNTKGHIFRFYSEVKD